MIRVGDRGAKSKRGWIQGDSKKSEEQGETKKNKISNVIFKWFLGDWFLGLWRSFKVKLSFLYRLKSCRKLMCWTFEILKWTTWCGVMTKFDWQIDQQTKPQIILVHINDGWFDHPPHYAPWWMVKTPHHVDHFKNLK